MGWLRRSKHSLIAFGLSALAFVVWTVLAEPLSGRLDSWKLLSEPALQSTTGQIASTVSMVLSPPVVIVLMLIAARWASVRRFNSLAGAIILTGVLTWSVAVVIMHLVNRPRPASSWSYLLTYSGATYPAGNVAAITAASICMVALSTISRHNSVRAWRIVGPLLVLLSAWAHLSLRLNYLSDVIGGILLGSVVTSFSLLICDVHPLLLRGRHVGKRNVAVIYNPTKVPDPTTFMRLVQVAITDLGWPPPIWLATAPDDPGHAMARAARDAGVDLVLVAGGDGTVRVVLGELANSGIEIALIPAGTGNLLARNLGIPLDYDQALRLLTDGHPQPLDILKFTTDDGQEEFSAVMAGVGADADVMNDTNDELKKQIGHVAYFSAALQHLKVGDVTGSLRLDDGAAEPFDATLVSIANVPELTGGLTVAPEAAFDDGILDIMVVRPTEASQVTEMLPALLNHPDDIPYVDRMTAHQVEVQLDQDTLFQIDGDVVGEIRGFRGEVLPRAVRIRMP